MRLVLALLMAACTVAAQGQIVSRESVHLKPIGSTVTGSLTLVNKVVPLPEGKFTLAIAEVRDAKFAYGDYARRESKLVDVVLGQIVDGRLRAAVAATTLLSAGGPRVEWTDEPCRRDDTLFKLNRVPFMKKNYEQDCLLVNHTVNSLGSQATGVYARFAGWIKDNGGATPIPTALQATITRIVLQDYLVVHYFYNTEAFGCDPGRVTSWAASEWHKSRIAMSPDKAHFADGVVEFGKAAQIRVGEAFEGHREVAERLAAVTPQVRPCGRS